MIDLRVIKTTDILPIVKIDSPSYAPLILMLTGRGFDFATKVYVNKTAVEPTTADKEAGFAVLSNTQIKVTVPKKLWDKVIEEVVVYGDSYSYVETTGVSLLMPGITAARGLTKAVQQFLYLLFTTPGTNLFSKSVGGGLGNLAGFTVDKSNVQGLIAKIHLAIKKCVRDIRSSQVRNANLSPEERLVDVIPVDASYDALSGTINVKLEFQTEVQSAIANVGVS